MKEDTQASSFALLASDGAFDPLEEGVRQRVRHFIETVLEEELQAALGRGRYERLGGARGLPSRPPHAAGDRHVRRDGEGAAGAHDR